MSHRTYVLTFTDNQGRLAVAFLEPSQQKENNAPERDGGYSASLIAPYSSGQTEVSVETYTNKANAIWSYNRYIAEGRIDATIGNPDAGDPTTL